jgi:hypothetical protein
MGRQRRPWAAAAAAAVLLVASCVAAAPLQQQHKHARISGTRPPPASSSSVLKSLAVVVDWSAARARVASENQSQPYLVPLLEIQIWQPRLLQIAMPPPDLAGIDSAGSRRRRPAIPAPDSSRSDFDPGFVLAATAFRWSLPSPPLPGRLGLASAAAHAVGNRQASSGINQSRWLSLTAAVCGPPAL